MGFKADFVFTIPDSFPIIGGVPVSSTVTTTWIIMAFLVIFSILATRNFKRLPYGVQNAVEAIVDGVNGLVEDTMGKDKMGFAPYMGTLMLYLLVANLCGLLGFRPPTADLNTT
ncbi:MAG: F0F1 ATP synthase subunit A, partial [Firmicutes bacterium]|nr:F0F1 ATP synthase subunit A [Bacillota bacterium]